MLPYMAKRDLSEVIVKDFEMERYPAITGWAVQAISSVPIRGR